MRSVQMLSMQPRFNFVQSQTAMRRNQTMLFTPISTRSIHARGYNNFDDNVHMIFTEINMMLLNCKNTDNIVYIYKKFGDE